jgi:hypothetical protein
VIGRPPGAGGAQQPMLQCGPGCAVSVGFFVHRSCGQPGIGICAPCGRLVCRGHLDQGGSGVCVECLAQQRESSVWPLDEMADDASFYFYRQGFYRRVYGSPYRGPNYFADADAGDRAALDPANLAAGDDPDAEDEPAGALDS